MQTFVAIEKAESEGSSSPSFPCVRQRRISISSLLTNRGLERAPTVSAAAMHNRVMMRAQPSQFVRRVPKFLFLRGGAVLTPVPYLKLSTNRFLLTIN